MIKKKRIIPLFLLGLVILCVFVSDVTACANGPNYWGDSFPGNFSSNPYQHPKEPSDYILSGKVAVGDFGYDGSHYGTHDWIADGAIRSLRNIIKNPLNSLDWSWLLNARYTTHRWPIWNTNYGSSTNRHEVIRSYMTYLFATQMPDMRITSDMNEEVRVHYPQKINIPEEAVIIEDFHPKTKNINKWVGQIQQHAFRFQVIDFDGTYGFAPYKTLSATKAKQLGEAAVKCIGHKVKNEQGIYNSAMQPEGAAGWLGAMTHYIADLVVPAHLLEHNIYSEIYYKDYHNWFENQLASVTKWDKANEGGPETLYFSYDIGKVGKTGLIVPIPPELAVTSMAIQAINIAYRTDGNHQHIQFNGNNELEAKNSGLFLSSPEKKWDWKNDIDSNTRSLSPHRYFYEKVEKLLCYAIYFIACAMQYCMNKGKEELDESQGLNPDYYVTNGPDDVPRTPPDPDPQRPLDDFFNLYSTGASRDKFKRLFKSLGLVIGPLITGIATMLGRMFHLIGR